MTELLTAVKQGNFDRTKRLIQMGADVNFQDEDDNLVSPLFCAASNGNTEICHFLISKGAMVNQRAHWGGAPLHAAANNGHYCCVYHLLSSGADPNMTTPKGDTPLHLAAYRGHYSICKLLIEKEANVYKKNKDDRNPLQEAQRQNQGKIIQLLSRSMKEGNSKPRGSITEGHAVVRPSKSPLQCSVTQPLSCPYLDPHLQHIHGETHHGQAQRDDCANGQHDCMYEVYIPNQRVLSNLDNKPPGLQMQGISIGSAQYPPGEFNNPPPLISAPKHFHVGYNGTPRDGGMSHLQVYGDSSRGHPTDTNVPLSQMHESLRAQESGKMLPSEIKKMCKLLRPEEVSVSPNLRSHAHSRTVNNPSLPVMESQPSSKVSQYAPSHVTQRGVESIHGAESGFKIQNEDQRRLNTRAAREHTDIRSSNQMDYQTQDRSTSRAKALDEMREHYIQTLEIEITKREDKVDKLEKENKSLKEIVNASASSTHKNGQDYSQGSDDRNKLLVQQLERLKKEKDAADARSRCLAKELFKLREKMNFIIQSNMNDNSFMSISNAYSDCEAKTGYS